MGFKEVITKNGIETGSVARTDGRRFWRIVGKPPENGYKVVLDLGKDGRTIHEVHLREGRPPLTFRHVGPDINQADLEAPMSDGSKRRILYVE